LLSVTLLLLTAGSGLAGDPQPTRPSEAVGVSASAVANAPWFEFKVDTSGDVGQHTSVAIDPSRGWTYVSYYDVTNQALRMARHGGPAPDCDPVSDWGCLTIDSGPDVGKYSSIAVNPVTGGIGMAYHDATNGELKYAYFDNPNLLVCSTYTIDMGIFPVSSTGLHTSLKYHPGGTPFIAYQFDNPSGVDALMVAWYVGSGGNCGYGYHEDQWQCDTIQTGEGVGQYTSLALDKLTHRHIAYYDGSNGDLWHATGPPGANCGPGNSWLCYAIDAANDVGRYASMYVDSADHFHIAYYDATTDMLKYAYDGSGGNCGLFGSAQCDTIDSMGTDYYYPLGVSIAEDAAGYPIIAYQSEWGLKVARPVAALGLPTGSGNCGPEAPFATWYCETIDRIGFDLRHGDYVSIALNSAGLATIAYYGSITASGGDLMVAQQRLQVFLPLAGRDQ